MDPGDRKHQRNRQRDQIVFAVIVISIDGVGAGHFEQTAIAKDMVLGTAVQRDPIDLDEILRRDPKRLTWGRGLAISFERFVSTVSRSSGFER